MKAPQTQMPWVDAGWFCLPIRVFYEDTDAAGMVYYANYLKFAERGRSELLRRQGVDHSALKSESGLIFAVSECNIRYRLPARLDDLILVKTRVAALGAARIEMEQEIWRGDSKLTEIQVIVACLSEAGRPLRMPESLRRAMQDSMEQGEEGKAV